MMKSGQIAITQTGRQTTPFPKLNLKTNRGCTLTIQKVNKWLMENALDEAIYLRNRLAELDFRHNLNNPSQADLDTAHYYLFGTIS